jgi:PAS domain S-box-containing protein
MKHIYLVFRKLLTFIILSIFFCFVSISFSSLIFTQKAFLILFNGGIILFTGFMIIQTIRRKVNLLKNDLNTYETPLHCIDVPKPATLDITNPHISEKIQRLTETQYRLLFENMASGFALHQMIYDNQNQPIDFIYIEVNSAFENITGLSVKNIIGKTIREVLPDMEEELIQNFGKVAKSGIALTFTNQSKTLGKYLETYVFSPEKDKFAVIFNDATERVLSEIELKISEQKFSNIFDISPNLIVITRKSDGKIMDGNPALTKITGFSKEEYLGQSTTDLNWWVNIEERNTMLKKIEESGEINNWKIHMRIKNGEILTCLFSARPLIYMGDPCLIIVTTDITELKHAEEQIRKNEARLLRAQSIGQIGYSEQDINAENIWVSAEGMKIYGFQPMEGFIPVKMLAECIQDFDTLKKATADLLENGKKYDIEFIIHPIDGSPPKYIHAVSDLEKDQQGNPLKVISTFQDVTNQKLIEKVLQDKEALLRSIFSSTPVGIGLTINRNFQECNDTFFKMTGYAPEEIIGKNARILYSSEEVFQFIGKELARKTKDQNSSVIPTQWLRKDGAIIDILLNFVPLDPSDLSKGTTFTALDISELKQVENKVRENEEKFRIAFDNAPTGMSMINADGQYLAVNPWLCKMFGYTEEELLSGTIYNITHPDDLEASTQWVIKMISGDNSEPEFAKRFIHKDGHIVWGLIHAQWLRNSDGSPRMSIAHILDITDQKLALEEIKKLNAELEKRVLERTAQLEQANKDLESFAYSVSHDLRAPIRHIDGFIRLLYSHIPSPDETLYNYYSKIIASSIRMSRMIDDLLTFSRLGRKELTMTELNLNTLILEIIDQYKTETSSRQISWNVKPLPIITGDLNLLRMAFENLISNAIKYTSKTTMAEIEIGANIYPFRTEIYIRDNGVGFNMAYSSKLFGVFQRLHANDEFEGTGIGLANVKQIINKHKGSIRAEGIENEGATFFVTFYEPKM